MNSTKIRPAVCVTGGILLLLATIVAATLVASGVAQAQYDGKGSPDDPLAPIWKYIVEAESQAVLDAIDGAHDSVTGPRLQWHSFQWPGKRGVGGTQFGLLQAFLRAALRIERKVDRDRALHWIVAHVHDTCVLHAHCRWTGKGNPTGEGCHLRDDGGVENYDGDILRHVDVAGLVDCAREPELIARGLNVDLVRAVTLDWGRWLLGQRWFAMLKETHRMGLPLNSLVAIYELTGDPIWLKHASSLLWWGWGPHASRVTRNRRKGAWITVDTGFPWEKRGHFLGSDLADYAWYEGNAAVAWIRFFPYASPAQRAIIRTRVLELSQKYVDRMDAPMMRNNPYLNAPMHGGFRGGEDSWLRPATSPLSPAAWLALPDQVPYRPLTCLYFRSVDGDYLSSEFRDEHGSVLAPRTHHKAGGPYLASDWHNIPALLYARYLVTGNASDRLFAIWSTYDYKAWADHHHRGERMRSKAPASWWGGAFGRSRGLAWRFLAGWQVLEMEGVR